MVLDEANARLGVSPQTWFANGIPALARCTDPATARSFFGALHRNGFDINRVHHQLSAQDMAWQPNPHSLECIPGVSLWQHAIAKMAANMNWTMSELEPDVRQRILVNFLCNISEHTPEQMAWHKTLCTYNAWALDTTFTWALDYPMPPDLHWVFEQHRCPSEMAMARIVDFCIFREGKYKQPWAQLELVRPDLTGYVQNYLLISQQLTGTKPSAEVGALISKEWRCPAVLNSATLPKDFESSI